MTLTPAQWSSIAGVSVPPAAMSPLEAASRCVLQKYARLRAADEDLTNLGKKAMVDLAEIRSKSRALRTAEIELHAAIAWLEDVLPPRNDSDVPDPAPGVTTS